jgi:hypothetical protein
MLGFGRSTRQPRPEHVRTGAVFRRIHPDQLVETARVLSVGPDQNGIPHVRFAVSFERARFSRQEVDTRMLALASFTEWYREPVEAAA